MRTQSKQSGFSLVELVVAVGILTTILAVAFTFVARNQVLFDANLILSEAHQNADFATLRVTEILRSAGSNPANLTSINNSNFIRNPTSGNFTAVSVLADLNGDSDTTDNLGSGGVGALYIVTSESITIRHNPTAQTIELVDNTPGGNTSLTLAEHITAFSCQISSDFRRATLTITGGPSQGITPANPRYRTHTITTEVRLRNRV